MNKHTIKRWAQHLVTEQIAWEARQAQRKMDSILGDGITHTPTIIIMCKPKPYKQERIIIVIDEPLFIIDNKKKWKEYKHLAWKITDQQPVKRLKNADKRGFRNYHLDHKVSVWYGYKNSIDPYVIGNINNLEFIPYKDNMKKNTKCTFNADQSLQTTLFI